MKHAVAAAALAALFAAPPAFAAERVYGGQPTPPAAASRMLVALRFDADGAHLSRLTYRVDMGCDPALGLDAYMANGSPTIVDAFPRPKRDGNDYLLPASVEGGRIAWNVRRIEDVGGSVTATTMGTFAGRMTERRITGTATFLVRLRRGQQSVDACSTSVGWRADRSPGAIFAGETAQHEPVVIELSPDRRGVRHAHVGWHAPCTSGSGFGEAHAELGWRSAPLLADGTFVYSHQASAIGALVSTRLTGRIGSTTAAGTFRGRARFRLPDGDRCQTGTLRWTAVTG